MQAPEVVPSVTPPIRRKERSLSSLVVSTPRVSTQTGTTGRRSKSVARKALRGSTFSVEKPVRKEGSSGEDQLDSASSPETLNKFTQNIRQVKSYSLMVVWRLILGFFEIFFAVDVKCIYVGILVTLNYASFAEFFQC